MFAATVHSARTATVTPRTARTHDPVTPKAGLWTAFLAALLRAMAPWGV